MEQNKFSAKMVWCNEKQVLNSDYLTPFKLFCSSLYTKQFETKWQKRMILNLKSITKTMGSNNFHS